MRFEDNFPLLEKVSLHAGWATGNWRCNKEGRGAGGTGDRLHYPFSRSRNWSTLGGNGARASSPTRPSDLGSGGESMDPGGGRGGVLWTPKPREPAATCVLVLLRCRNDASANAGVGLSPKNPPFSLYVHPVTELLLLLLLP